jgi:hypothetical protein
LIPAAKPALLLRPCFPSIQFLLFAIRALVDGNCFGRASLQPMIAGDEVEWHQMQSTLSGGGIADTAASQGMRGELPPLHRRCKATYGAGSGQVCAFPGEEWGAMRRYSILYVPGNVLRVAREHSRVHYVCNVNRSDVPHPSRLRAFPTLQACSGLSICR